MQFCKKESFVKFDIVARRKAFFRVFYGFRVSRVLGTVILQESRRIVSLQSIVETFAEGVPLALNRKEAQLSGRRVSFLERTFAASLKVSLHCFPFFFLASPLSLLRRASTGLSSFSFPCIYAPMMYAKARTRFFTFCLQLRTTPQFQLRLRLPVCVEQELRSRVRTRSRSLCSCRASLSPRTLSSRHYMHSRTRVWLGACTAHRRARSETAGEGAA